MDTRRWKSLLKKSSFSILPRTMGVYTPNLPVELWLQIFQFAVADFDNEDRDGFCPYVYTRSKYAHQPTPHQTPSHSFLTHTPAHTHLPERLAKYNARLKWKAALTRVCRVFNIVGQEILFEDIWISSSKDGRRMAARLGGTEPMGVSSVVTASVPRREREKPSSSKAWWKRGKPKHPDNALSPVSSTTSTTTTTLTHRISTTSLSPSSSSPSSSSSSSGQHIRHLRIETPPLDKCSPHDILLILQHCPLLSTFHDFKSIRRPMHPLILSSSEVVPFTSTPSPASVSVSMRMSMSTDALSQAILSRPLKEITWTNYTQDFHLVVTPLLTNISSNLRVLEIVSTTSSSSSCPALPSEALDLPALTSLKATLDNPTFHILSTWSIPSLRNLSIISTDFSYSSTGFSAFFASHGASIRQLELGHSSNDLEEFYLTSPHPSQLPTGRVRIPLDEWCPNLKEFICSADAQWNWQSPDWIAPHILLPAHPTLEFIGIKFLERRLISDLELSLQMHPPSLTENGGQGGGEYPYFPLLHQFSSLLHVHSFPSLRYIRDMSWDSDLIRRTGVLAIGGGGSSPSSGPTSPAHASASPSSTSSSSSSRIRGSFDSRSRASTSTSHSHSHSTSPSHSHPSPSRTNGIQALRFWKEVLEGCRERGVWLEDWRGVNVTMGDLRRAGMGG